MPDSLYKVYLHYDPLDVSITGNVCPILRDGLIRKVSDLNRWSKETGNHVHIIRWYARDPGELVVVMRDRDAAILLKLAVP